MSTHPRGASKPMGGMRLANIPQLTDEQWAELVERLTLHAACRLLRLHWRGILCSRGGAIPGGVEPDDIASAAIVDVIEGKRSWDRKANPDFLKFLRGVVDSKVSHLVQEVENRKSRRLALADSREEGATAHGVAGREPDPAEFVQDREAADRFRVRVMKALEGDEIAANVFECLDAEYTKPQEIAELLGLTVPEINNAQKRLRRKVSELLMPQGKGGRRG
jgi:DNA-directed RNA polymerase specialized sigma24 family protein